MYMMCVCLQEKCEQYWPGRVGETISVDDDKLIVLLNEIVPFADYELRKITIYYVRYNTTLSSYYYLAVDSR